VIGRRRSRAEGRPGSSLSRGFDFGEDDGSGGPDGLGQPNTGLQNVGDGEGGRGSHVSLGGKGAPQVAPNGSTLPNPK